jgi:hypothetical protein
MRSSREASGDDGPQIVISESERKQGAKNIRPWMWSRWRWVSRMLILGSLAAMPTPSDLIPVPASMIRVDPSESSSSTQEVLPP